MRTVSAGLLGLISLGLLWQGLIHLAGLPPWLLPPPLEVIEALITHRATLTRAVIVTGTEMLAGLVLGALVGTTLALAMTLWPGMARTVRPLLLISQTLPIFALAPILTLWLGHGMAPKITVAVLIAFLPVASAMTDALSRLPPALEDQARLMEARPVAVLWHLRLPHALSGLASGLRVAAIQAPVGAVIGEWVGGSEGLGAVMIHANGRMKIDLVFAALALITLMVLAISRMVEHGVARPLEARAEGRPRRRGQARLQVEDHLHR